MNVLVTGATGFMGGAVCARLLHDKDTHVRAATRRSQSQLQPGVEEVAVGDFAAGADWQRAVAGVDAVVHLAGRAHIMNDTSADPLAEFRRMNVAATMALARAAAAAGVKRFVFMSSVKVHGEAGTYRESDVPLPTDPYGVSKHEAEQALRDLAAATGMHVVIIRPPLVYGPGVRANFHSLVRAVASGVPLPFGAIHNRRSLVGLGNLADFVATCVRHPAAGNETFLVSDGDDLSTPELVRRLARAMHRRPRLIPVPAFAITIAATLAGRRGMAQRLIGSLQVDITKARTLLAWSPPRSVDDELARTVAHS